jgi:excisionase family DNA binding protein
MSSHQERQRRHSDLPPAVLDRHGAANYLSLGLTTLAELTATGSVPSLRVGRRRLYRVADLDAWLAEQVDGRSPEVG